MQDFQTQLKNFAINEGAALVGFCKFDTPPLPQTNLNHGVIIAVKLSDAVLSTIEKAPSFAYFQHYRTANALLDSIAFKLSNKIEGLGFNALPIAASQSLGHDNPYCGYLSHKAAATLSGLGFVGKSGLFISTEYGSKIRLATILTDMPVKAELPIIKNGCGDCNICRDACPAGAIYGVLPTTDGERNFDAEKCSRYMKDNFQQIGRGSVCGICIKSCPKNKLKK